MVSIAVEPRRDGAAASAPRLMGGVARYTGGASPLRSATGNPTGSALISHRQDIFVGQIQKQQICSIGRNRRKTKKRQAITSTMLTK